MSRGMVDVEGAVWRWWNKNGCGNGSGEICGGCEGMWRRPVEDLDTCGHNNFVRAILPPQNSRRNWYKIRIILNLWREKN
jgi:hypothetical protein